MKAFRRFIKWVGMCAGQNGNIDRVSLPSLSDSCDDIRTSEYAIRDPSTPSTPSPKSRPARPAGKIQRVPSFHESTVANKQPNRERFTRHSIQMPPTSTSTPAMPNNGYRSPLAQILAEKYGINSRNQRGALSAPNSPDDRAALSAHQRMIRAAHERSQRLTRVEDASNRLHNSSLEFGSLAKQLANKYS